MPRNIFLWTVLYSAGSRLEGLDRMRVTLKMEVVHRKHGDYLNNPEIAALAVRHNLDLYNDVQVEKLIRKTAERLEVGTIQITKAIADITAQLEYYRLQQIEYTKPTPGFDSDGNNHYVSKLDGSAGSDTTPRVGPSLVLKVMAGDTITIGTYGWYQGTVVPPPSGATNLLNDLLSALTGQVIGSSHGLYNTTGNNPQTILSGDVSQFFTNKVNTVYTSSRPKAFLNWIAFDNQLKEVDGNSGVVQVPAITGTMAAQPMVAPILVMQKNGYIYIHLSNESAQNVFFDNLVIHHNRGPILQEDHYYPFGLTMAGISDQAPLKLENKFKFQGQELQHKEFSDGSGLETYQFKYRMDDPQTGRFWQIDPLADKYVNNSPYAFSENKVTGDIELEGLEAIDAAQIWQQTEQIAPQLGPAGELVAAGGAIVAGAVSLFGLLEKGMEAGGQNNSLTLVPQSMNSDIVNLFTKDNKSFGGENDTKSKTANNALNKAKEQNSIPKSQQPDKTIKPNTPKGNAAGLDNRNKKQYEYTNSKGEKVVIRQDKAAQYDDGGTGDQPPHFNAGKASDPKLKQHHYYDQDKKPQANQ